MQNALNDYIVYCRVERRLAELTWMAYERVLRHLIAFLRDQGISALAEVRTRDLRAFIADQAERRPAPSNQAQTVVAIRCFFRFCVESDYLDRDPAYVLRTPKKREALPDVLDRGELSRLLDVPGKPGVWTRVHTGKIERDRLLLALFAYGGLRRGDHRPRPRRNRPRPAPSPRAQGQGRQGTCAADPHRLIPLFTAYLAVRADTADPALFLGVYGKRLSPSLMALTFPATRPPPG